MANDVEGAASTSIDMINDKTMILFELPNCQPDPQIFWKYLRLIYGFAGFIHILPNLVFLF